MSTAEEYWITAVGMKSFAVMKKNSNGMVTRVGIYRSYKKASSVRDSLANPTPHIQP